MKISFAIKRILLSIAVIASLFAPGVAIPTPTVAAQPMDDMSHVETDFVTCQERHQTPAAINKDTKQLDSEDEDEPTSRDAPYYVALRARLVEPAKPIVNLIESPSFVPPDIVILTCNLRI